MAINPVVVKFLAEGVPDITRALRGISDVLAQTERRSTAVARRGSSERRDALTREVQDKVGAIQRATGLETAARRAGLSAAERAARADARAARQIAAEKIRQIQRVDAELRRAQAGNVRVAVDKVGVKGIPHNEKAAETQAAAAAKHDRDALAALAKERDKSAKDAEKKLAQEESRRRSIRDKSAEMAGKFAAKQSKDAEKEETKRTKGLEKEEARRNAIRERSAAYAGRFAAKQVADELRERKKLETQAKREDATALRKRERFVSTVMGAGGRALRNAGGVVHNAASRVGGTLMQLGGGFSVSDAIKEQAELEREAMGFVNSAENKTGLDAAEIKRKAKAASAKTGVDAGEILAGARSFQAKTGNSQESLGNMEMFGEIAKGTGASVADIANAAGTLRVQNKNLSPEKMKEMLLQVVRQGQLGSIEFSDLAGSIGKITKSSASYAGDQGANQAKLLGLAQVAMATSGSPQEASTVISNISMDAMKHNADVTAALGKGTFNARGQIAKAPEEFISDVMDKTGGNLQKIQAMGFGARSMKMFQALAPTFNEAVDSHQSGRQAVLDQMKQATASAMPYSELQGNVKKMLSTSAEQFESGVRQLKTAVGDQLLPEFVKLVPVLKDAIPTLTKFLQALVSVTTWATSNPFEGFALLVGGFFLKELAAAGIANKLKSILAPAGGGGGGATVPTPGAASGAPGAGGTATPGAGLGAAALIAAGGAAQIHNIGRVLDAQYQGEQQGSERANKLAESAKGGDVATAKAGLEEAKGNSTVTDWLWAAVNATSRASSYVTGGAAVGRAVGDYATEKVTGKGPEDLTQIQQTFAAQQIASNDKLLAAIQEQTTVIKSTGGVGGNGPGGAADPNAGSRNKPLAAPGRY